MSDKDPFAEPDDADRTIIRPNPGGRRGITPAPPPFAQPAPVQQAQPAAGMDQPMGIPSRSNAAVDTATEPGVELSVVR